MILYFLWSSINALGFLRNDINYFSILNFYENDSQFQNIPPSSPQCNELRNNCDYPWKSAAMFIFSPETNLKKSAPNRNQVQSWDSEYGDHSSPKQPRKFIFTQLLSTI